jgi:hypothetical protein
MQGPDGPRLAGTLRPIVVARVFCKKGTMVAAGLLRITPRRPQNMLGSIPMLEAADARHPSPVRPPSFACAPASSIGSAHPGHRRAAISSHDATWPTHFCVVHASLMRHHASPCRTGAVGDTGCRRQEQAHGSTRGRSGYAPFATIAAGRATSRARGRAAKACPAS